MLATSLAGVLDHLVRLDDQVVLGGDADHVADAVSS
jgi:hypothetical protein